jgi:DNA-binding transcriptional regulator YdaS (Cro superfamily)
MEQLNLLIDKASSIAGSQYKLGQLLGISHSTMSQYKSGRPCPPEDVARIAAVAGYEPVDWLVRATLEKHAGTKKGEQLAKVLGKALLVTGAASGSFSAAASTLTTYFLNTMYIM